MTRLAIVLGPLLGAMLAAQQQEPPFRLPEGVEMKTDLVYARYGQREMHLDLFLPKAGAGPFPAVVYIHGGGWRGGNKGAFRRQAAHMATQGFVGACIEYRLSGEAKYPAAVHDAKAAVRWLRANAAAWRIRPDRIGAAGGSAGGHLVALLGATHAMRELEGEGGNPGQSSRVQAVAPFNPALDLEGLVRGNPQAPATSPLALFLGFSYAERPDLYRQASPVAHVSKASAPFLFLHGTDDKTTPYEHSVAMMKKLQAAGVHAEIFTAEGAGHGFFNRPPWFEPTLKRMEAFFTRLLK
ncbi:MAG: alpha/beta hydrolase [Acidobacteriota bacterium]